MSARAKSTERKGLSCAECRRSKLKCDRVFPCQSCIRRNCASICPDGTLAATKRNKVLVEHAQKLTDQVKSMCARIHDLEAALAQSQNGGSTHPLLQSTGAQNIPDVRDDTSDRGLMCISMDCKAASSEYPEEFLDLDEEERLRARTLADQNIPFEVVALKNAFPFGLNDCPYSKSIFVPFLPSRQRAIQIADLYYVNVAWMSDPITRHDFMSTIIDPIYGNTGRACLDSIHSHSLSIFFMILASGMPHDPSPSAEVLAEEYHVLAQAALCLDPLLTETTCATVQALFLMFRFSCTPDRRTTESRWLLVGLCCRLAQRIGLQRDADHLKLPPDEVKRRRVMFWELYVYDVWTSMVLGRPTAFSIQHTDCTFPDGRDVVLKPSGDSEWGWHAWKFRYSASCLSLLSHHMFLAKMPPYSTVLEIDKEIRKFPIPSHLQSPISATETNWMWSTDPAKAMQQYCAMSLKEFSLLYIHRCYFAQAIRQNPDNILKHAYTPSVLATYRGASRLISTLKSLFAIHPVLTSRVWFFWSSVFSACIVLAALVVESPGCTLAQNALQELDQGIVLYNEGSRACRPSSSLVILQNLLSRAYNSFNAFHAGISSNTSSTSSDPNRPDSLEDLGGSQVVLNRPVSTTSPSPQGSTSSSQRQRVPIACEDGGSVSCYAIASGFYAIDGGSDRYMLPTGEQSSTGLSPTIVQTTHDLYTPTSLHGDVQMEEAASSFSQPASPYYPQYPSQPLLVPQLPQHTISGAPILRHAGPSRPPEQNTANAQFIEPYGEQNLDEIWCNFVQHLGIRNLQ